MPEELVDEDVDEMDESESVGNEGGGGVRGLLRPKEFVDEGVRRMDELESVGDEGGGVCGAFRGVDLREGRMTFRAFH